MRRCEAVEAESCILVNDAECDEAMCEMERITQNVAQSYYDGEYHKLRLSKAM